MNNEKFKYAFAEKNGRSLCLKFNEQWELICWEHLVSKGYIITPASENHWNRQIGELGATCECYELDDTLEYFDIGEW